ncbi:hypothetical protein WJ36_09730 [Burkholderia ubonensis]|uniref:fimbria/pilus outer membrane usher protein n=1 Tax=Burkholderia ubonensis TaxID=101571 RepID=UPI00076C50D6|nr:fimbria/pilus outer membrane usher protein [Burkholderia ubonensis]KVG83444.1 hypothetical protein WJ36_09730 [Burkholderia ubonensis]
MKTKYGKVVQWRRTVIVASVGAVSFAVHAAPGGGGELQYAQFDTSVLRARGLDSAVADYFRGGARFTPGTNVVQVTLNGVVLGRKSAMFGPEGQLCFTPAFVRAIGLRPIVSGSRLAPADAKIKSTTPVLSDTPDIMADAPVVMACPSYEVTASQTSVSLNPGESAVDIVVPAEYVTDITGEAPVHGGTAGIFDYRLFDVESGLNGGAHNSYRQLDSLLGFNMDDWIVRSRQFFTETNGHSRFQWQEAFAQRTFVDQEKVLQLGRTWTQVPLFGGIAFTGVQWFPELALSGGSGIAVSGVANSRARVEVRQNGVMVYSTVVPPGPFTLKGVQTLNTTSDLQVRVIEDNGATEEFVVPAATLMIGRDTTIANGYSVAAGRFWDPTNTDSIHGGLLMAWSKGWNYGGAISGLVGGLLANGYSSVGAGVRTRLSALQQTLYAQLLGARDSTHRLNGLYGNLVYTLSPFDVLQFGLSVSGRTIDYRTVQEAHSTLLSQNPYHMQYGANATWNTGVLGALTASVTRQTYFNSSPGYLFGLGWGISLGRAQLSVSASFNTRRTQYLQTVSPTQPTLPANNQTVVSSSNYLFATLTIPLGHQVTSSSYYRRSENGNISNSAFGTGIQQQVTPIFNYSVNFEQNLENHQSPDATLTANVIPHYTSVTLGASTGQTTGSVYGQLSGGVVVQRHGVAFSPYPVQDTFGLLKIGEISGIKIDTPQGPVWSGPGGLAVVPALSPFHESRLEIAGNSIPQNIDIDNGLQVVNAAHGAVLSLTMGAKRVRRVLLAVDDGHGADVAEGLPVLAQDEFMGTTLAKGRVMLPDLRPNHVYRIELSKSHSCTLRDIAVVPGDDVQAFEHGTAHCE